MRLPFKAAGSVGSVFARWNFRGGVTAIHRTFVPGCSSARYSGASSVSRRDMIWLVLPSEGVTSGRPASSVSAKRPGVAPCRITAISAAPEVTRSNWRGGGPSWPAGKISTFNSPPLFSVSSCPHSSTAWFQVWFGGRKLETRKVVSAPAVPAMSASAEAAAIALIFILSSLGFARFRAWLSRFRKRPCRRLSGPVSRAPRRGWRLRGPGPRPACGSCGPAGHSTPPARHG